MHCQIVQLQYQGTFRLARAIEGQLRADLPLRIMLGQIRKSLYTMPEIIDRLKRCFGRVFVDIPEDDLSRLAASSHDHWDSLAMVSLVGAVEEEFRVSIPVEHMPQLLSFREMLNYLSECER